MSITHIEEQKELFMSTNHNNKCLKVHAGREIHKKKREDLRVYQSKNKVHKTYCAFAKAVERPTNRTARSVCDDMYLILDTIT